MRLWPFVFLALVGCIAKGAPYYFVDTSTLDDRQRAQVIDGLTAWQTACDAQGLQFRPASRCAGADHCITVTEGTFAELGIFGGFTSYHGSETDTADIVLRPDASQLAITHELGHAMGLGHTGPGTLMCVSTTCASPIITPADVEQFASLH